MDYEARDRDIVALGWDAHLVGFACSMLNWARSVTVVTVVTVVTNGHHFDGDEGCRSLLASHDIELVEQDAVRLLAWVTLGTVAAVGTTARHLAGVLLRRPRAADRAGNVLGLPPR